ncbi:MAG: hypothetical protein IIV24_06040 [Alistipes sp.]|nr:hypothetical protein [Alistipes sp.]
MKRYTLYIMSLLIASLSVACHSDIDQELGGGAPNGGGIVLSVEGGHLGVDMRAGDVEDTTSESAITHLDVMIFNDSADEEDCSLFYHERVTAVGPDGTVRLGVNINDIVVGARYWVFAVANSTHAAADYAAIANLKELLALNEETFNIHLTASGLQNTPTHFLMDGAAYKGTTEPASASAIVIAEQQITDVVTLKVKLRRAAAKVVVLLSTAESTKMRFADNIEGATPGYYMRNTPYESRVINDGVLRTIDNVETTHETMSPYYKWVKDGEGNIIGVEITTYVYSHIWETSDSFSHATNLLVDIPCYYTTEVNGESVTRVHPNNYYQVPLSKDFRFERNHYYSVTANVYAPGAEDFSEPVEVENLKYSAYPWTEKVIDVGGEAGPEYLKVNLDFLKMFNTDIDATSLLFASSSPVTITVENIYFIDKFGFEVNITNPRTYHMSAATEAQALSGNITVNSDVPTNNTIRYFTLRVENETGQVEYVEVEQYPLVYIKNQVSYYSYRSDFATSEGAAATPTARGSGRTNVALNSYNSSTGRWSYNYNTASSWNSEKLPFFYSNVVRRTYAKGESASQSTAARSEGRSNIDHFSWSWDNKDEEWAIGYSGSEDPANARMYHIRITATSKDYKLTKPRMITDGNVDYYYTDPAEDNRNIVSPSFMTASRLGVVFSGTSKDKANTVAKQQSVARDQCAYYVEVTRDPKTGKEVIYDDFRLPTEAELMIITELQGTADVSADAIDYLLNGIYYYAASGRVFNPNNDQNTDTPPASATSSWGIRCVRDAY